MVIYQSVCQLLTQLINYIFYNYFGVFQVRLRCSIRITDEGVDDYDLNALFNRVLTLIVYLSLFARVNLTAVKLSLLSHNVRKHLGGIRVQGVPSFECGSTTRVLPQLDEIIKSKRSADRARTIRTNVRKRRSLSIPC